MSERVQAADPMAQAGGRAALPTRMLPVLEIVSRTPTNSGWRRWDDVTAAWGARVRVDGSSVIGDGGATALQVAVVDGGIYGDEPRPPPPDGGWIIGPPWVGPPGEEGPPGPPGPRGRPGPPAPGVNTDARRPADPANGTLWFNRVRWRVEMFLNTWFELW